MNSSNINPPNVKTRILSIDALRGFDMIWILGAEGVFAALFTLTNLSFFHVAAEQMKHSMWHGFTAYDLIFPLFIFLSGVSIGIAGKPMNQYPVVQQKQKLIHAFKRLFLLLFLGVIYNHGWGTGLPTNIEDIRFASVLGKIGIAWFCAAILVWYVSIKMQWTIAVVLLVGYYLLLTFVEIGGYGAGNYSSSGALNAWFDQMLLPGTTYQNLLIDPEGVLSNVSSIVNALCGVFIGRLVIQFQNKPILLLRALCFLAGLSLFAGYLWGIVFPINKTLWTSSFVLVTCGYSILLLAIFYALVDVLKLQGWSVFFAVIGTNSIIIYLASSLVNWQYTVTSLLGGVISTAPANWQALLSIVALVGLQWLVLLWLYRRKIYIKV